MAEYGYDIANIRAYSDAEMTIEIPLQDIPEDQFQKILGGISIVRCKDCRYNNDETMYPTCDKGIDIGDENFFCAFGELRKKNRGDGNG